MKGTFSFDPADCEYGEASDAIRRILSEWMTIDWFSPRDPIDLGSAAMLFRAHHQRAHAIHPDVFPGHLDTCAVRGGWRDFSALVERVRYPAVGWDWKFSGLKKLTLAHSKAHGWSPQQEKQGVVSLESGASSPPGALFFLVRGQMYWNSLSPKLDLKSVLSPAEAEVAYWYLGYASMDLTDALEWQLADKRARLEENPFVLLLRCYLMGIYPFSMAPSQVTLFAFDR